MKFHVLTPFSRPAAAPFLIEWMRGEGVIWHPLPHFDYDWPKEEWLQPQRMRPPQQLSKEWEAAPWKLDHFKGWVDEDYYAYMADDETYAPGAFLALAEKQPTEDLILFSLTRGDHVINGARYRENLIVARPGLIAPCFVDFMQYVVKGKLMKQARFSTNPPQDFEPRFARWIDDHKHTIRYEPLLFGLFNYLQPGRFDGAPKLW